MLRLDLGNAMLGINNRNLEDFTVDLGTTRVIMQSPAGQEVGSAPLHLLRELRRPGGRCSRVRDALLLQAHLQCHWLMRSVWQLVCTALFSR